VLRDYRKYFPLTLRINPSRVSLERSSQSFNPYASPDSPARNRRGRRRIGKSRLVEECGRGQRFLEFAGLAPTQVPDAQMQRDEFSRLLIEQTGLPRVNSDDWSTLFQLLPRPPITQVPVVTARSPQKSDSTFPKTILEMIPPDASGGERGSRQ